MGKSSKKSHAEVAVAAVSLPLFKSVKKGKRSADVVLEKPVSAKKQKNVVFEVQEKHNVDKKSKKDSLPKKKVETSSSEDLSDSEEEKKAVVEVQTKQNADKKSKKVSLPIKKVETSSSEDMSDSEEEVKIAPKKGIKPEKQRIKKSGSNEKSSSDKVVKPTNASKKFPSAGANKNGTVVASKKKDDSSDEDSSSSSDEENESLQKVGTGKKAIPTQNNGVSRDSSSESDEEEVTAKVASTVRTIPPKFASQTFVEDEFSESSSGSSSASSTTSSGSSSDSDSDEEDDAPKVPVTVKSGPAASKDALKPSKKKNESSDSSESDSDSDEDEDVTAKAATIVSKPPPKVLAKASNKKEESSESSDSDSDEEDDTPKVSVTTKIVPATSKAVVPTKPKKKDESSDSSESDSDEKFPPANSLKRPGATKKKSLSTPKVEEDSEDSDSESDEEPERKKLKEAIGLGPISQPATKSAKKESSSSDEDDSSDESSDEETTKAQQKKQPTKPVKSSSSEESSEEDSSDESEDGKPIKTPAKKEPDLKRKDAPADQTARKFDKKVENTPASNQSVTSGSKTLFVGNLSYDVGEDEIMEFFQEAGEVVDIRLAKFDDGQFKGFGHVEFSTADAAKKALHDLTGKELLGRPVKMDLARERGAYTPNSGSFKKAEGGQAYTLFVRGFDKSAEMEKIESSLREHFGSCGEITRLSLPRDYETGGAKGIAYIDYKSEESFNDALELSGSELGGYSLVVEEARPRGDFGSGGRGGGRDGGSSSGRGGGRRGGRGGRDGGWSGGRGGGRGRDGGRRGRGGGGRFGAGTTSQGKKTTFGDD